VALVRVYCGLATADPLHRSADPGPALVAVAVDDLGRTLDVRELTDDARGYARLTSLLAERSSDPYSVAVAVDSEDQLVPQLLITAGWATAVTDRSAGDAYAERFADPLAGTAAPLRRRALGMARALRAGLLAATALPPPAGLAELKPLLAAETALATGRHGAAVALREVLRELYPAALRAYPDPSDPVALAVLDALPEPAALAERDTSAAIDSVAAKLVGGTADRRRIADALTALRVAIAESPRNGIGPDVAPAAAHAVRQAVAAVGCCDVARRALIDALAQRLATLSAQAARPAPAHAATSAPAARHAAPPLEEAASGPAPEPAIPAQVVPGPAAPASPAPVDGWAAAASAVAAAGADSWSSPEIAAAGAGGWATGSEPPQSAPTDRPVAPDRPARSGPARADRYASALGRPVSSPPPPPGIVPIPGTSPAGTATDAPGDAAVRVPTPRPAPEGPPPGGRENWPTSAPADDDAAPAPTSPAPSGRPRPAPEPVGATTTRSGSAKPGKVTPPWLADDLRPPEPPPLRLVEPSFAPDPSAASEPSSVSERRAGTDERPTPPLRLVEPDISPRSAPPVDVEEGDEDLLIFAEARSAWFNNERAARGEWSSPMDEGWRAAEQAANPAVGELTPSGLPRRVPHANLVPGSPPPDRNRPLRVVRDPSRIAANTSGYFNGWRKGQEVGGYPLGNRVGSKGGGAWEFSRDDRLSG
jgi:hypothetical protein